MAFAIPMSFEAWFAMAIVLGLCVGSFVNVVVYRLPIMMEQYWHQECQYFLTQTQHSNLDSEHNAVSLNRLPHAAENLDATFNLAVPRSHCPHCKTPLAWWHNVPVLSFLLLKGRCGHCQQAISMRYPAVEVLCAALFAWVAYAFPTGPSLAAAVWMLFAAALLTLTLIDLDTFLLPDSITQPLLWLGLIWHGFGPALGTGHVSNPTMEITLNQAVLGAILGYAVLGGFAYAFRLLTGKEGMGQGDFKLLAALGAWLGAEALFTIVLFAAVFGIFFGPMVQWLRGKALMAPFPFGPCLVAGGCAWLAGVNLYALLGQWALHG